MNAVPPPSQWIDNNMIPGLKVAHSGIDFFTLDLIPFLINFLLITTVVLSLIFLIIGGIRWTISGGDKEALTKAKGTITYALVGLALAFSAFVFIQLLETFFGVPLGVTKSIPSSCVVMGIGCP